MNKIIASAFVIFGLTNFSQAVTCKGTCAVWTTNIIGELAHPTPNQQSDFSNYCQSRGGVAGTGPLCRGGTGSSCAKDSYAESSVSGYGVNEYEAMQALRKNCELRVPQKTCTRPVATSSLYGGDCN